MSTVFGYTQLNVETVLFLSIQFNINTQLSSVWPIDKMLSGATTSGQSGSGSDGDYEVLCLAQTWNII